MELGVILGAMICIAAFALWPSPKRMDFGRCGNCGQPLDREPPCDYCGWQD